MGSKSVFVIAYIQSEDKVPTRRKPSHLISGLAMIIIRREAKGKLTL